LKDVQILKPNSNEYAITPESFIVPKGEEGHYHVIIEVLQFNPADGSRVSRPRIQTFGPKWFESMEGKENLERQGYKLIILHDPKVWISENAKLANEQKAEKAKAALEAKEKADQEKAEKEKSERDADIASAVRAALEAYGIKPGAINPTKTVETKTEKQEVKTETKAAPDADKK
jgi:hypothetical protein